MKAFSTHVKKMEIPQRTLIYILKNLTFFPEPESERINALGKKLLLY